MAALPVGLPFNAYACKTAAGQIHHSGCKLTSRRSGKITGGSIYGLATCSWRQAVYLITTMETMLNSILSSTCNMY